MFISMTKEFKEGETACYGGLPFNRNPYLHTKGCVNSIKCKAWEKGFLFAESQARGA